MPIHVNKNGVTSDFDKVSQVYISDGTSFSQSKEVYVYNSNPNNGPVGWEPLLFEASTNVFTATGTIDVPVGAFRVVINISGASGGTGGNDASAPGGSSGDGATLSAMIEVVPHTTLSFSIGAAGGNGTSSSSNAAGGGGGTGHSAGGTGGRAGPRGSSGGGGGGGGSSSIALPNGDVVMLAAGGGGGGGAGHRRHLSSSNRAGKDSNSINTSFSPSVGGNGLNCPCFDGGAGGGGGAGNGGAAGGLYYTAGSVCQITPGCVGNAYDNDGFGAYGGTSFYNEELINGAPTQGQNSGVGSITLTWLKAEGF